ncbi:hypothetical protein KL86DYS1_31468 [uncultured Dysgonomonas sp.]|uniref:Uncharacterized protein n=1 Tax=uncultured Dysgonomonas sp. TaxID=206096 RepID=A0A212K549_9BACT|nr:hypothetical protein KL86DYS1_31468 [uncultured Dysgonomonas sp.]
MIWNPVKKSNSGLRYHRMNSRPYNLHRNIKAQPIQIDKGRQPVYNPEIKNYKASLVVLYCILHFIA